MWRCTDTPRLDYIEHYNIPVNCISFFLFLRSASLSLLIPVGSIRICTYTTWKVFHTEVWSHVHLLTHPPLSRTLHLHYTTPGHPTTMHYPTTVLTLHALHCHRIPVRHTTLHHTITNTKLRINSSAMQLEPVVRNIPEDKKVDLNVDYFGNYRVSWRSMLKKRPKVKNTDVKIVHSKLWEWVPNGGPKM